MRFLKNSESDISLLKITLTARVPDEEKYSKIGSPSPLIWKPGHILISSKHHNHGMILQSGPTLLHGLMYKS